MAWKDAGGSALGSSRGIAAGRSAASAGGFTASGSKGMSAQGKYNLNRARIKQNTRAEFRGTDGAMSRGDINAQQAIERNRITQKKHDIAMKKLEAKRKPISGPKTSTQARVDSAFGADARPIGYEYRK